MTTSKRPRKSSDDLRRLLTKELKNFADFDWWPTVDSHFTFHERRLLSEFDLEPNDSAAWFELDREIQEWLEGNPEVGDEMTWQEEYEGGPERLAWYQSMTFYGPEAGIFITTRGILVYSKLFLREFQKMQKAPEYPFATAMKYAMACLLAHEAFHHDVESFGLKLAATVGAVNLYSDYHRNVYVPNVRPLSDLVLEESLASATEFRKVSAYLDGGLTENEETLKAVLEALEKGYSARPPGYRMGSNYLKNFEFKTASYDLIRQIAEGRLVAHSFNTPNHFPITKGRLHDAFVDNAVLIENLFSAQGSVFTLAVPSHHLERYVRQRGFVEQQKRGKGSHSIWKGPNGETITLPHRKDQQGFNTLKSTATALGFASARELVEAVR
jgi:predicted RNA binding protein YcfA (HicA-like mRNA interferase family)